MKRILLILLSFIAIAGQAKTQGWTSVQAVGVLPGNSAEVNRQHLQAAIDKMSPLGGVLYVEPVKGGYPMEGGLVLKRNVTLLGGQGPTGRGTALPDRSGPRFEPSAVSTKTTTCWNSLPKKVCFLT